MVERTACPTDLRGAEAAITPAGMDRLRNASVTHLEGIHRLFLDVIPEDERAAIERGLTRVTDGLGCKPVLAAQAAESCGSPAES